MQEVECRKILIKNVDLVRDKVYPMMDIRIRGEKIKEIIRGSEPEPGEQVIDGTGCMAIPGGVDVHTHLDMPCGDIYTSDDYYSGTLAAVAGGTTTIMDFPEPERKEELQNALERWMKKAKGNSFCDYGFHMTMPDCSERTEKEIENMIRQGVGTFKAYTAYKDSLGLEDRELYCLMELIGKKKGLLMIHCENGDIIDQRREELAREAPEDMMNHPISRPDLTEHEAISRVLDMAQLTGAHVYIVHVSTKKALEEIEKAKKEGVPVYCETCPQYLFLTEDKYRLPGKEAMGYICSPPLRKKADVTALWEGIKNGTVDTIATDHCSFYLKGQKEKGIHDFRLVPGGLPGIENRLELIYSMAVLHENNMTFEKAAWLTAENPARIMGLYPKKGILKAGSDADIVLLRTGEKRVITVEDQYQKTDYTPYEGMTVYCRIHKVFRRGELLFEDREKKCKDPLGNYIFTEWPE